MSAMLVAALLQRMFGQVGLDHTLFTPSSSPGRATLQCGLRGRGWLCGILVVMALSLAVWMVRSRKWRIVAFVVLQQ
jgi:hypothetical protein